jgi:hypothetical protein
LAKKNPQPEGTPRVIWGGRFTIYLVLASNGKGIASGKVGKKLLAR